MPYLLYLGVDVIVGLVDFIHHAPPFPHYSENGLTTPFDFQHTKWI